MCGIIGLYTKKFNLTNQLGKKMLRAISHRGPDNEGLKLFNTKASHYSPNKYNLLLGHRRLSIIDLSSQGNQPMSSSDQRYFITYNGEIYNFQELKKDLVSRGYIFHSNTDTEVLLNLYIEFGPECLKKLQGFFSFCIYDLNKKKLFLARDRLGAKPLKYSFDGENFSFASEIGSLVKLDYIDKGLDFSAIKDYLSLRYIPSPKTIYKDIKKLPAGYYIDFNMEKFSLNIIKYWEPSFFPKYDVSYNEAKIQTLSILEKAVSDRLISDVPLGVYLSGGIDSSTIVAILSKIKTEEINTFSVGFQDDKFDERGYAKSIAKKFETNHTEFLVEPKLNSDLERIIHSYDEPFADPSIIPTHYLAQEVSKHVRVALGGDGADEILAGYKRYKIHKKNFFLSKNPSFCRSINKKILRYIPSSLSKKQVLGKFSRILESLSENYIDSYYMRLSGFTRKQTQDIFGEKDIYENNIWSHQINEYFRENRQIDSLDQMLAVDQLTHLPEYILTKSDISGMSHGLEIRAPFIDVNFVEWTNRLESTFKFKGYSKRILKDILFDLGVDRELVFRKKSGFTPPLRSWMIQSKENLKYLCLSKDSSINFLNSEYLEKFYLYNSQNNFEMSSHAFMILCLGIWLEKK